MQPVEKVNKLFVVKLCLLCGLLYLGYVMEVPQLVKSAKARPVEHYAAPNEVYEPKQIKKLYYRIVADPEPEEIAI
ncbi:hypothetical protein [Pontibacter populi]|uniref:Uncharacterized protein n=1 Tax=Pontibacter populi TaxID=890055 RepID=A0ABV1RPH9_9BACT